MTLLPFLIRLNDDLSHLANNMSRQVDFRMSGFVFAVVCVVAFCVAYFYVYTVTGARWRPVGPMRRAGRAMIPHSSPAVKRAKKTALIVCVLMAGAGVAVTVASIGAGSGYVEAMFSKVATGESAEELIYSTEGYITSTKLPGIVRMFSQLTAGAVFVWLVAGIPKGTNPTMGFWLVTTALQAVNLARGIVAGDRSPAFGGFLAIAVVFARMSTAEDRSSRHRAWLLLALVISVVIGYNFYMLSATVRGIKDYDTLMMYADLGIANFMLAIETGTGMTFGFSTVLAAFPLAARVIGLNLAWPEFQSAFVWAPPGNMLMYAFQDFQFMGFIVYLMLGGLVGYITRRSAWEENVVWRVCELNALYALSTVFTVPIFTGPSFWAVLIVSCIVVKMLPKVSLRTCHRRAVHLTAQISKTE